jgi:hypothetical protein
MEQNIQKARMQEYVVMAQFKDLPGNYLKNLRKIQNSQCPTKI